MVKRLLVYNILFFILSYPGQSQVNSDKPCKGTSAKAQISEVDNEIIVSIEVQRLSNPIKYVFFNSEGERVGDNLDSNEIRNVPDGTYNCIVKDKKGCTKRVQFTVESKPTGNE
ncbi:MAG: hypothetical protein AAGF85_04360 [Bacteroidota bacterium]